MDQQKNKSTWKTKAGLAQMLKGGVIMDVVTVEHAKIAVVPGSAFEAPGYMRLSYATSMENIKNGMDRLEAALK